MFVGYEKPLPVRDTDGLAAVRQPVLHTLDSGPARPINDVEGTLDGAASHILCLSHFFVGHSWLGVNDLDASQEGWRVLFWGKVINYTCHRQLLSKRVSHCVLNL